MEKPGGVFMAGAKMELSGIKNAQKCKMSVFVDAQCYVSSLGLKKKVEIFNIIINFMNN